MATIRCYNVRPTANGSGSVLAKLEVIEDDGRPTGLTGEVLLTSEQVQSLGATYAASAGDLDAVKAMLWDIAAEVDERFTFEAVTAFLDGNAASLEHVAGIGALLAFPFDIEVVDPVVEE